MLGTGRVISKSTSNSLVVWWIQGRKRSFIYSYCLWCQQWLLFSIKQKHTQRNSNYPKSCIKVVFFF